MCFVTRRWGSNRVRMELGLCCSVTRRWRSYRVVAQRQKKISLLTWNDIFKQLPHHLLKIMGLKSQLPRFQIGQYIFFSLDDTESGDKLLRLWKAVLMLYPYIWTSCKWESPKNSHTFYSHNFTSDSDKFSWILILCICVCPEMFLKITYFCLVSLCCTSRLISVFWGSLSSAIYQTLILFSKSMI